MRFCTLYIQQPIKTPIQSNPTSHLNQSSSQRHPSNNPPRTPRNHRHPTCTRTRRTPLPTPSPTPTSTRARPSNTRPRTSRRNQSLRIRRTSRAPRDNNRHVCEIGPGEGLGADAGVVGGDAAEGLGADCGGAGGVEGAVYYAGAAVC